MADFKWTKGNKPKETGNYLITIKEDEGVFTVVPDTFFRNNKYPEGHWIAYPYENEEIVAYAPYPAPYRTRNRNGSKSNNRKTNNKTK